MSDNETFRLSIEPTNHSANKSSILATVKTTTENPFTATNK
jgi:hypothetical protein